MKTKISLLFLIMAMLTACSKSEVVAPPKTEITPPPQGETSASGQETPSVPTGVVEVTPPNVQGAEVAGKAQDMPEGTKEGEHTSNPLEAPTA